jgi:hypothetical protein
MQRLAEYLFWPRTSLVFSNLILQVTPCHEYLHPCFISEETEFREIRSSVQGYQAIRSKAQILHRCGVWDTVLNTAEPAHTAGE